jgi:hypothetical protein
MAAICPAVTESVIRQRKENGCTLRRRTMFHGRSATELGLASAVVLLSLIQRLEKKGTLKREDALALLGDAADRLVATPRDTTVSAQGAADLIRKEFLTKI